VHSDHRRYCFCNARRRRKGFGERVRWLHLETDDDPQLPTHGPKVFIALAINIAAKYRHHIGKSGRIPINVSDPPNRHQQDCLGQTEPRTHCHPALTPERRRPFFFSASSVRSRLKSIRITLPFPSCPHTACRNRARLRPPTAHNEQSSCRDIVSLWA